MSIIIKSFKYIFVSLLLIICFFFLAFLFIKHYDNGKIYNKFFKLDGPQISLLEEMGGIGANGNTLKFRVKDDVSGVDEVKVKLIQKRHIDLMTQKVFGAKEKDFEIPLDATKLKLTEGAATIIISAFDKSFYNNSSELKLDVEIDARSPSLKVISTQHNLILNGIQLVIYKASDDNLKRHGVLVGEDFFQGFPINLIDNEINDNDVYGAFYTIQQGQESLKPKVIVEDKAGNKVTKGFYNKVIKRRINSYPVKISQYFLNLMKDRFNKENEEKQANQNEAFLKEILIEKRKKESKKIFDALYNQVFKTKLTTPFELPQGTVVKSYGSTATFYYANEEIDSRREEGITFALPTDTLSVKAISDGMVIFVKKMQSYGNVVAVAHGANVVAIYAEGGDPLVAPASLVKKGDPILKVGNSGVSASSAEFLLEIRIDGYPINPQEFFDGSWCASHITGKLRQAKDDLGLLNPEFDY